MTFEVKSTNLLLLRDILEGKYDEILAESDKAIVFTNDSIKLSSQPNSIKNRQDYDDHENCLQKGKRLKKRKSNFSFYLKGNSVITRDWLREKKMLTNKRKTAMKKQRKEERLRIIEEDKEKQEKELRAREAYDKWLKETRKPIKSRDHDLVSTEKINHRHKSSEAIGAYELWLQKKISDKRGVTRTSQLSSTTNEDYNNHNNNHGADSRETPSRATTAKYPSSPKYKSPSKPKVVTSMGPIIEIDDDMNDIIKDLRKEKTKEKERSKKRVNSGIFVRREKIEKSEIKPRSESFLWRKMDDGGVDREEADIGEIDTGGDSRSRFVDRITHQHVNPFAERTHGQIRIK